MAGSIKVKMCNTIEIAMNMNSVYGIDEIISNKKHKSLVLAKTDCSIILIPSIIFKQDMSIAYAFFSQSNKKK